jgi:predicted dehydrogenase
MIAVAEETGRKLMIAYRLHYEPFNQRVMELCQQEAFGPIRTFSSSNCQNVDAPNIRLQKALGGGPVQDIGIYSINAARYITGEEPVEVVAFAEQPTDDPRFQEVPASVSYLLRFPSGVLAHCDCSFASTSSQRYRVHCQSGYIEMDPAFAYSDLALRIRDDQQESGDVTSVELPQINQFAAEIEHFSTCILNDKPPRTPGEEGLADVRIIVAIEEATRTGRAVRVASA